MMNDDEINLLRKKLTIAENNLIDSECHISELINKLAEYESIIEAFCDDDENWHKLTDRKNEIISILVSKLASPLAKESR
ncbi:hypothetical protein [Photorhabdus akhurstii]|uniref:hypothetical protein n=1 Tax=Photorhabdus akhurstii TaxID=171438 RepID=UPI0037043552